MIRQFFALSLLTALVWAGCTHAPVLKPDPAAPRAPGSQDVAIAEIRGVRVAVSGNAWKGNPSNLTETFTPVQVTIENHSGRPIRVSYQDFGLKGGSGFTYAAIPPVVAAQGQALVEAPNFYYDRFFLAPHLYRFYPGYPLWPDPFYYDPLLYNRLYGYWPAAMPSKDMLSQALPEGVVQDGGKVTGFVYFEGVTNRESHVDFVLNLVDANNNETLGQVVVPFVVSK
jgi:hypothetical protein